MTFSVIDVEIDMNLKEVTVKKHSDRYTCLMISTLLQTVISFCDETCYSEVNNGETFIRFDNILEFSKCIIMISSLADEIPDKFHIKYI